MLKKFFTLPSNSGKGSSPAIYHSTTLDEKSLIELIKEAIVLAAAAESETQVKAAKFELQSLLREIELREREKIMEFQSIRLGNDDILEYQRAIHVLRTQVSQTLADLEHKEFML